MSFPLADVQSALRDDGLDGWLLYDFQGSNAIARRLTGVDRSAQMTTRRWYYFVPREGKPRGLVHAIEASVLDALPGTKRTYAGRDSLEQGLTTLLAGARRVAMEYSPDCAIPYVSRVDAGTIEHIRRLGVEVASSGDLMQRFEARWSEGTYEQHRRASDRIYRIKDRAFAEVTRRLSDKEPTTEYDLQQAMVGWFGQEGLISDAPPNVSTRENAGNPHYLPTCEHSRRIEPNQVVLLDLWGRLPDAGAPYADICWVGFTGTAVPDEIERAFSTARAARDAALALVQRAAQRGDDLRGWQVDREARGVIERAGYGDRILHRTGHSLGSTQVHGNGVHMDDYETHDDRRIMPGTGFTIEPGIYFPHFGVRTEINVYVTEREAVVSGPCQSAIVPLAP